MSTPFSRTTRSLNNSSNHISQIGLFTAILLAFLWGYWFFGVPILAYETSREISVTHEEDTVMRIPQDSVGAVRPQLFQRRTLIATFPPKVLAGIQPGQSAFLRLEGKGKQRGAIPALVVEIMDSSDLEKGFVKLHTMIKSDQSYPFTGDERGEISIERQQGVPAHLVFRVSGFLTETSPISVSPSPRYHP